MESLNNEKVVAFRVYNTVFEANVVKELLASNGIPSMVKNEQATVLLPMFSSMTGVTLMILEKDLDKVIKIVDGANDQESELIEK